jgi:CHAT domain-containing protein/Tfp pilus assembly protein PilF
MLNQRETRAAAVVLCLAVSMPAHGQADKSLGSDENPAAEIQNGHSAETRWDSLRERVAQLSQEGRHADAIPLAREALQIAETTFSGPDYPLVAVSLNGLAQLHQAQGKFADAEPLYKRALEILEKALGLDHRHVAAALTRLAQLYQAQGRYADAEPLYKQALAILEKALGLDHRYVAAALTHLAILHRQQGRYADAEALHKRALAILEKALGETHPNVAASLNNLAALYETQGRYNDAGPLHKRALAITEEALGPDHPDVATSLNNLALLYESQGKYADSEPLHKRALEIWENAPGGEHPRVALSLNNLAALYWSQGRYAEAEPLYLRALEIDEKTLGGDHPDFARTLNNLGTLNQSQGRYVDAEHLYRRSLAIREKVLGPSHPDVAQSLNNLAEVLRSQGKNAGTEILYKRALAILGKTLGPNHPEVAQLLSNLAELCHIQRRYSDAEQLCKRSLAIREKTLGPDHPDVAQSLINLAEVFRTQGWYTDAEPLYQRALEIDEKALGVSHPEVATCLMNLAVLASAIGRPEAALPLMRRALLIDEYTVENVFSLASEREKFAFLRTVIHRSEMLPSLVVQELSTDPKAVRTALDAVLHRKGIVLDALSRERTALLASDNPQAAIVAAQLQSVASRQANLTLSRPATLSPRSCKARLDELKAERERLEEELARLSDAYVSGRRSRQVVAERVSETLESGSALLEYTSVKVFDFRAKGSEREWGSDRYLAFVMPSGQQAAPVLVDLGEAEPINLAIRDFRKEMVGAVETISKLGEAESERRLKEKGRQVCRLAFAPLEEAIGGSRTIYLAPDGDLNLVPFGVLADDAGRYLAEIYQFNYLSSGRDLLRYRSEGISGTGVVLIADPDYNLSRSERELLAASMDHGQTPAMRNAGTSSFDFRQTEWSALPDTRREVEAIARIISGQAVQVYTGADAREETVKGLRSPRTLHLATHGFFMDDQDRSDLLEDGPALRGVKIAGFSGRPSALPMDIENPLLRSGLVLAGANRLGRQEELPPGADDGILTALEISGIPLWGTDLVVLSACETGLGEARRGEGVFGLRRAFQLAGARTVVMSLWAVPDEETVALMTDFYGKLQAGVGKARALQESSLGLMRGRRETYGAAHPFYWGAFVSVGEP